MTTYVCYHLPSDRDEADHPNAFTINKQADDITLKDIKDAFPIPGQYHFRFKVKIENGSYWLDCTDDKVYVPVFSPRRIVAKVLRLSWKPSQAPEHVATKSVTPKTVLTPDHADLFGSSSLAHAPKTTAKSTINKAVGELDLFS